MASPSMDREVDHAPESARDLLAASLDRATAAGEWGLAKAIAGQLERLEVRELTASNVVAIASARR